MSILTMFRLKQSVYKTLASLEDLIKKIKLPEFSGIFVVYILDFWTYSPIEHASITGVMLNFEKRKS